ncbi:MAG: WG repeat-containing protein [Erysipelotrichaceae bacterium]|nr:WG repeat-containing protein [Erysipelotrichaceae bacterium]
MRKVFLNILLVLIISGYILPLISNTKAESVKEKWNLVAEKTDIKCTSVYNVAGYAVTGFDDEDQWPWYGLVSADGKYIVEAKKVMEDPKMNSYGDTFIITDGMICDYRRGYYNLDGSEAFDMYLYEPSLTGNFFLEDPVAMPFHNGYTLIQYTYQQYVTAQGGYVTDDSPLYLVDHKGNVIEEREHNEHRMFYGGDGMYVETDFRTFCRFYDYQGNLVTDLSDQGYGSYGGIYQNGYCWVGLGNNGPYGFVDISGNLVVPCVYDNVNLFNEGLAAAQKNGKWGYINTKNETVIPFEYDAAYGAGGGLASVGKDGKFAFVDYSNNVVMDFEDWDDITSFTGETAYGIKDGTLYVIKNQPVKKGISPVATIILTTVGVGIIAGGALGIKAGLAAGAEATTVKAVKVKFGHKDLLICSSNEELIKYLKSQPNLKVKVVEQDKLIEQAKKAKADLIIVEISSDDQLNQYVSNVIEQEDIKSKHGLIISGELSDESKKMLEEMKQEKKIISFLDANASKYRIMSEIVLPVMKPDVSSDASLKNIGSVADALGIPYISKLLDVYSSGRSIKNTIEESKGDINTDDTVSIINDIADILDLKEVKEVTGVIKDIKKVGKAVNTEAGAYELKEGVKGTKDIIDILNDHD